MSCLCFLSLLFSLFGIRAGAQNKEVSVNFGFTDFSSFIFLYPDLNFEGNFITNINQHGYFDVHLGGSAYLTSLSPLDKGVTHTPWVYHREVLYITAAYGSYLKRSRDDKFKYSLSGGLSLRRARDNVVDSVVLYYFDLYYPYTREDIHYDPGLMAGMDMEWIPVKSIGIHLVPDFYIYTKGGFTLIINAGIAYRFGKENSF